MGWHTDHSVTQSGVCRAKFGNRTQCVHSNFEDNRTWTKNGRTNNASQIRNFQVGTSKRSKRYVWPSRTPFNTSRNIGDFLINFLIKIFHCTFPISLGSLNLYTSTRVSNSTSSLLSKQRYTVTLEGFRLKHLQRVLIELLYEISKNLIYQMIWTCAPDIWDQIRTTICIQNSSNFGNCRNQNDQNFPPVYHCLANSVHSNEGLNRKPPFSVNSCYILRQRLLSKQCPLEYEVK